MEAILLAGFVYAVICGLAGIYVANQKGRAPGEGLVFAVLFGPIGLVVAACLPTVGAGAEAEAENENEDEWDGQAREHLAAMEPSRGAPAVPPPLPTPRRQPWEGL